MTEFLAFTITGIVTGAVYAIAASGLVVTYTTSGIFNFAHGAIGMVMAFLYWQLRVHMHWPAPLALIAVLFIAAPLFGALIERVLMRNVRGSDTGVALMVTLGLLLALIGVAFWRWKQTEPPRMANCETRSITLPIWGTFLKEPSICGANPKPSLPITVPA